MTFLEGVTRFCEEANVNTSGLTTVVGRTGELRRMVNWYASAWTHIQRLHDNWRFMRLSASWALVASQAAYTTVQCGITTGTFRKWDQNTGRTYVTATGFPSEMRLTPSDYETFRDLWLFGSSRTVTSTPLEFTVGPDDSILFGPAPIAGLTATMDYYKNAVLLAADADIPALPLGHDDMIIVHRAKMFYGAYWNARECYASGEKEYKTMLTMLVNTQLPALFMGGALA